MDPREYYMILFLCLLCCGGAFIWLRADLIRYQRRVHSIVDTVYPLHAGVVRALLDHEARLAKMEGGPFVPATLLDRLESQKVVVSEDEGEIVVRIKREE